MEALPLIEGGSDSVLGHILFILRLLLVVSLLAANGSVGGVSGNRGCCCQQEWCNHRPGFSSSGILGEPALLLSSVCCIWMVQHQLFCFVSLSFLI